MESMAAMDFVAVAFDDPPRSVSAWARELSDQAGSLLLAERVVRSDKAQAVKIVEAAEAAGDDVLADVFDGLNGTRDALRGWADLIDAAEVRLMSATATVACEAPTPEKA